MTPTEQDKELLENSFGEWLENHGVELIGNKQSHLGTWRAMVDMNELKPAIMQLITADRKRVALEARLAERKKIALDYYRGKTVSDSTNWQAKFEYFMDSNERRIAELKAQQEKPNDQL